MDGSISYGAASTLLDSNVVGGSPSAFARVSSLGGIDAHSAGLCGVRGSSVGIEDILSTFRTRQSSDRDKLVGSLLLLTFLFFWYTIRQDLDSVSAYVGVCIRFPFLMLFVSCTERLG